MSLYEGAVKKPIMTSLCFLAVAIFGLFSLSKLPVDLYPDIETNTIMVMTTYQGASASDIENNVTRPLENVLNSVSNLKHITSRSSENISVITLEFEYGYDIDVLTNDVRDKLDMVSSMLPDEVETPIIFKFSTDMIPILLLSVQAEESQPALYKILDDNVANPLARVPGVGTVSISGAPKREVNVYCDPNKLDAYNLSVETISSIISAENRNTPGGTFDVGSNTYSLRVEGEFKDPKEMENIVVGTHNGASVYLRDVAKVVDSVEERAQKTYSNGVQGAMIVVQKQSGANSVAISQKVIDMLPQNRLNWAVRHRLTVMAGCAAFFVASLFCAKYIGTEFFPAADNSRIGINLQLPIGARVERAEALASELTNKWMTRYGDMMKVCNYTVGQADSDNTFASMQDNGSHIISFNISLVSPGDRDVTLETVCDEMREDLKGYPELDKAQVILGGSTGGMSAQASADFEVYGYDFTATDKVSAELKEKLLQVKGVSEVNISRQDYQPEYQVDFDREKLALHGLNLSTASNYLRNRVNGALASYYREDGDEYDIRVRYAPEFRTKIEDLENILIYTPSGEGIRVKDLGKVVERSAPPTIERKDRERIVTVSAVISGAPLGDVVADGNAIIDKMDLPSGASIQISGSYEDQQDSFSDLGTLAVLIVILVFIVMAAQFESLSYPFIIMFSIPFAFSGVLMALFFTGTNLNVMSLLGGIMLIGIVVKNGIVLIDYITLCRERGQAVLHSVVTAGRSRLRPVLMTTLTTILGMVPMAVGQGEGAEMWRPLGVAVIGGLTVSTILTLILVPVLYCSFAGVGIRRTRKKIKKDRELNDYYQLHKEKMTKPRKQ